MAAALDLPTEPAQFPSSARDRMIPPMPGSAWLGWLGPLAVTVIAGLLRFDRLAIPKAVVFDETFYATGAQALLQKGVELKERPDADERLLSGATDIFVSCAKDCADYVVHPPFGKWMIAAGEWLFGPSPYGWRVAAALIGTLSVFLLARAARRMTRSTLLGCLAGLLLALDGLHYVLSRFALLDVFLTFWIIAGFACLLVDRDRTRGRLADWGESTERTTGTGPYLGLRPWRLSAVLCLGLACAVKWSGVFFLIALAVLSLSWDMGARRAVGLRRPYLGGLILDAPHALLGSMVVAAAAYVATWAGWFASPYGYGRDWTLAVDEGPMHFVGSSLKSWWAYQTQILNSSQGLSTPHNYMSEPWEWPVLARPVAFSYTQSTGCGAGNCVQAVLGIGTPAIWWTGILALIAMIAWYVAVRDWRAGAVLLVYVAGWAPWFYYAIAHNRTMYLFYALPMLPFLILALVLMIGLVIGPGGDGSWRRSWGAVIAGVITLVVIANFWWLYPILSAELIPHAHWQARMWFPSWV